MKILYIVKTQLHYYPPCISQIRMLKDLGYDVEVLYGTSDESALKLLAKENIFYYKIAEISDKPNSKFEKLVDWCKFRKGVLHEIEKRDKEVLLWFGTAESVLPLKGAIPRRKYVLSLLELLDDSPWKVKLLERIVQKATAITVCEETRGYIMRAWWNLKEVPFIFPNKPYNQLTERRHTPSTPETKQIIEQIKDEKVILYQGILQNTGEIIEIAKALKQLDAGYMLLLMGIDKYNSVEKIKTFYEKTMFVSYIPAPYHLEITSYAHIGIVFYRNDSLNKVFCAPNKIYEYSGFGIPMLANDIPGLKNTVGNAGAAECLEMTADNLVSSISRIEDNYERYSQGAKNFFAKTDNLKTMKRMMEKITK